MRQSDRLKRKTMHFGFWENWQRGRSIQEKFWRLGSVIREKRRSTSVKLKYYDKIGLLHPPKYTEAVLRRGLMLLAVHRIAVGILLRA